MAPPPEYDKEPKAPDKSVTNISTDDSKVLYSLVKDHQNNSDHKSAVIAANAEIENNKHVGALDDGQLRALLDEAIAYKRPKDREGKSSLFKELLEEVEQDEQACEAAARSGGSVRGGGTRRGVHGRRALPHSNSLQDLMAAALAAEPPRHRPHPPPAPVSARAHHGGSLPSGVDTSFLLSEEPTRAGYLATVRCVNPPPLAERVSASDANGPAELDHLNRRSKPMFPMTYTARATLEIGSGSVCSGRAVTTTTASNQVCTKPSKSSRNNTSRFYHNRNLNRHQILAEVDYNRRSPTFGPPERLFTKTLWHTTKKTCSNRAKLLNALQLNANKKGEDGDLEQIEGDITEAKNKYNNFHTKENEFAKEEVNSPEKGTLIISDIWKNNVENWYNGINEYYLPCPSTLNPIVHKIHVNEQPPLNLSPKENKLSENTSAKKLKKSLIATNVAYTMGAVCDKNSDNIPISDNSICNSNKVKKSKRIKKCILKRSNNNDAGTTATCNDDHDNLKQKKRNKEKIGTNFIVPNSSSFNIRNFREMTVEYAETNLRNSNTIKNNILNKKDSNLSSHEIKTCKLLNENKNTLKSSKFLNKGASNETRVDTSLSLQSEVDNCKKSLAIVEDNENLDKKTNNIESKQISPKNEIEMLDTSLHASLNKEESFSRFVNEQKNLLQKIKLNEEKNQRCKFDEKDIMKHDIKYRKYKKCDDTLQSKSKEIVDNVLKIDYDAVDTEENEPNLDHVKIKSFANEKVKHNPDHASITLLLPKSLFASPTNSSYDHYSNLKENEIMSVQFLPAGNNDNIIEIKSYYNKTQPKTIVSLGNDGCDTSKNIAYTLHLLDNDFKGADKLTDIKVSNNSNEVDSAIPFSCITTPEVVTNCNTTSSTSQSTVAVDPKPLQLGSCYRAVTCLTGEPSQCASASPPATLVPPASPAHQQPRSVISSSFNGLPLSRPNYGATATTSPEEYKKTLDENGNAVQGFSSPLSGSSQHKKPRRKKSSKNETVIKSQEIDGYQGNKDLNEVLRFIESNADSSRAHKMGRTKHKDEGEDKGNKRRSNERRKDKEKVKRATSMEELSRTKLEDLTDKPRPTAPPSKPERRSWGEDARRTDTLYLEDAAEPELTDFQTVTKKRRQRRRTDVEPPHRTRTVEGEPRAPHSDRSNDSNDDMDSVHSLPAARPPPSAHHTHASYADIARTRHNIPDLIESCNYYTEPESSGDAPQPASQPDVDGYPALETRARRRDKPPPARPPPKDGMNSPHDDCPAPDVVSDRRPPVILLDSVAQPRDMDGVTFGFDINEQLLGGARRPRCDLVRDALHDGVTSEEGVIATEESGAREPNTVMREGGVAVHAGCAALHYVPPAPPRNTQHLHQIIDYVGAAWEDVVRCVGTKVRYFSE